jgi:long-chain fatty acid transport protein
MPAIEGSSLAVRLGGQYRYSAKLALLAGLAFEQTPVQGGDVSPMFPDADRFVFSGGATYKVKERIAFSVALRFENMRERREVEEFTDRLIGTYKSYTYVAGIGINYSF